MDNQAIEKVLAQLGRTGWKYSQPSAETKQVPGQYPGDPPTNAPTGRYELVISDGQGNNQKVILRPGNLAAAEPEWIPVDAPESLPKPATAASTDKITDPYGGTYVRNPQTGQYEPQVQGSTGAYEKSLTEAAEARRKLEEIQANKLATGFSLTDAQAQQLQLDQQRQGLDAATLRQRAAEFQAKNANDIRQLQIAAQSEARLGQTAEAERGLTRARTAGVGVETATNEERLRQIIAMGPATERQAVLNNEVTEAQLEAARQKLKQPTVLGQQTGAYMTTMTPEGQIQQQMSLGYAPKTQAEVQARIGQIAAAANAKNAELQRKYANDPDRHLQEFNAWYDANVQSQIAGLEAARQEATQAQAADQAARRQASMTSALGAGTQAINAYNAAAPRTVGDSYIEEMGKLWNASARGEKPGQIDYVKAFARPSVDLNARVQEATANALKYIDPASAQQTGQPVPNYSGLDPAQVLNRSNWQLPAPGPGGPAAPVAAGGGLAQAGPTGDLFHATPIITNPQGGNEWSYQVATGPEAAPEPEPEPVAANPMQAAVQRMVTRPQQPRWSAPPPTIAPAVIEPSGVPGFGYDPSAMAGRQDVPGMGYDPSNIAVMPPPPQQDYMAMIPTAGVIDPYAPPPWVPPTTNPVVGAAQGAYRRVPRTNWR